MEPSQFSSTFTPPPPPKSNAWIWWLVGGLIVLCLLVTCCGALGGGYYLYTQGKLPFFSRLDPQASPLSGSTSLVTGFTPDPFTAHIYGGGSQDGLGLNLQNATACAGFYAMEPSYALDWVGGTSFTLRMFAVEDSGMDATMIVRDPDGNYYCNDDASDGGIDPMIDLPVSLTGRYVIWLGSYAQNTSVSATFYITELDYSPTNLPGSAPSGDGSLDPTAYPLYGNAYLNSGFIPDPYTAGLYAGGEVDAYYAVPTSSCNGYATVEPSFQVEWSGSSTQLRFFFVSPDGDTTMIVSDPNGNWSCNDDSGYGGLDPMVDIYDPVPGTYSIWVASYAYGNDPYGTLYVTETDLNPTAYNGQAGGSTAGLDYSLAANYGETTIGDTTAPETYELQMASGGSVYVPDQELGMECLGYVTSAPDFQINYEGDAATLRIFFVSNDGTDTTLVVNSATGVWLCNDDAPGYRHPMVEIPSPVTGVYDIWVGTYGSTNTTQGTLYITEGNYGPGNLP
jgi:serine protease Do